ncbi:MAG TPA: hypothetical protein VK654_16625 [Nitrospirota bacterium]|nr:hypothetical protein [Nitrospirota bacterium]
MMNLSREQEKKVLIAALGLLVLLVFYRIMTAEKPRTAPLTFPSGAVARSAVRQGLASGDPGTDPLNVIIARSEERYPGMRRDIFRMANPAPKPKPAPVVLPPAQPPVPVRTPEEIAADAARADLAKFRFLGYLTDQDNTLFLSKDGELFIVKAGQRMGKSYQVKEAGKDFVIIMDTETHVEVRADLSGSEGPPQTRPVQPAPPPMVPPMPPRAP